MAPLQPYSTPCTPPRWARGGHAQTLLGHLLPARPRVRPKGDARPVDIVLEDGERLVALETPGTSGVHAYLFHGLAGDADSSDMRHTAALLAARGHGVWRVNHRGCGAGRGLATRPYHSGSTGDMRAVLAAGRAAAPNALHLVIGFSLSGNVALLMAAQREQPLPDALIAVNPPVDLAQASLDIRRGLSRLYELRFMLRLRAAVAERDALRGIVRANPIPKFASLMDFDDLYTAPEGGFENGADYYRRCSSLPHLAAIRTPSVILTAGDDPFVDARAFQNAPLPAAVHLHVEPSGGHIGYVASTRLAWTRWLDGALGHYVDELVTALRVGGGRCES